MKINFGPQIRILFILLFVIALHFILTNCQLNTEGEEALVRLNGALDPPFRIEKLEAHT
jgi:hypothetical protein